MRTLPLCIAVFGLAGCNATWPYDRIGTWRPTGTADANIAASIANPSDLVLGVEYRPLQSTVVTAAIERYKAGKVRPLSDVTASNQLNLAISPAGDGGAGATGGTAAAQ